MLQIHTLIVGELQTNCYLVWDSKSCETIIVDPGDDASYIAEHISKANITPVAILATHGHFDHILSAFELQHIFHTPFYIHIADEFLLKVMNTSANHFLKAHVVEPPPTPSKTLQAAAVFSVGSYQWKILVSPGHTPGSVCFYCPDKHVCITGDTVFAGGAIGDWHHTYSDKQALLGSVRNILSLPEYTMLYPGHGDTTTVHKEAGIFKKQNL